MADTATDVRVVAAAEPGSLAAEANAAVRPVSMPVVDRVAGGVGTGVAPIVVIVEKYFGWTSHLTTPTTPSRRPPGTEPMVAGSTSVRSSSS